MERTTNGWINGLVGVVIFSGSLPATRAAVVDFDPVFYTLARAAIAGLLGLAVLLALHRMPASFSSIRGPAWAGLAYVSVFSMLIGFGFCYRGLALGAIGAVGQLQLLQPFFWFGPRRNALA